MQGHLGERRTSNRTDDAEISENSSRQTSNRQAHTPISGSQFFNEALSVTTSEEAAFRVYYSAPVASQISEGTVFVCHHGAGYSGLSFARFAEALKATQKKGLGILALDARGHGMLYELAHVTQLKKYQR